VLGSQKVWGPRGSAADPRGWQEQAVGDTAGEERASVSVTVLRDAGRGDACETAALPRDYDASALFPSHLYKSDQNLPLETI